MPVACVSEHDVGIAQPEHGEFAAGGADHRFEVAEVRRLGGDLGGDDELSVVDRELAQDIIRRQEGIAREITRRIGATNSR